MLSVSIFPTLSSFFNQFVQSENATVVLGWLLLFHHFCGKFRVNVLVCLLH